MAETIANRGLGACCGGGSIPNHPQISRTRHKDQDRRGQKDDSVVPTQTEGAYTSDKHESAQGIDDVRQGIQMRNGLQPAGHDGRGINRVARKEQRHGEDLADSHVPSIVEG